MKDKTTDLIDRLERCHGLSTAEYEQLITAFLQEASFCCEKYAADHAANHAADHAANYAADHAANHAADHAANHAADHVADHAADHAANHAADHACDLASDLAARAVRVRQEIYGRDVYVRGLIEISNICKNDCYYCGIRRSNLNCDRYRLTPEEILACADEGYALGFRTFVMQGGEDGYFTDERMSEIIRSLKRRHPDCAVTLSLGERSRESYQRLYDAGADRYLLRHETANPEHYAALHPPEMSYERRMNCLRELRGIGYQVGCGFMVGSPGQTPAHLANDLKFIEEFRPEMCGIGPFIPHKDTPFRDEPAGTLELTCFLLSVIRLIHPKVLLPSTTALGTIHPLGRERGILSGANVVMPNLSPVSVRKKYELYDNKICTGDESAQCRTCLESRMRSIGYQVVTARGDAAGFTQKR